MTVTFITWNIHKAQYLSKYLWYSVNHQKIDLDELQSLDLQEIVDHKLDQAYKIIKQPVLVEDVSLEFTELGRLPWTFIKQFMQELSFQQICDLVPWEKRWATARCVFWYYDWIEKYFFEWSLNGSIAHTPQWDNGFGRDPIFIPDWYQCTRAQLNEEDDKKTYLKIKPFEKVKKFLESRR